MKKEERQKVILEYLSKEHRLTLQELSVYLNVSEDTIRRDVKELSDKALTLQPEIERILTKAPNPMGDIQCLKLK